ncbi:hypothetical protein EM85_000090 [Vibrio parahaemolyticus]|nr:hypothetical protein EM85_000090 [Vibrio parahaemolyticus]
MANFLDENSPLSQSGFTVFSYMFSKKGGSLALISKSMENRERIITILSVLKATLGRNRCRMTCQFKSHQGDEADIFHSD